MKFIASLLLLLSIAFGASADYWLANNGLWYYGNSPQAYLRRAVPVYSGCGYSYQYSYVPYQTYADPVAKETDWKSKLIELARDRDEAALYLKAVNSLGLHGTAPPYYGNNYNGYSRSYGLGVHGTTLSGYTAQQVLGVYGESNVQGLLQQYAQITKNAQAIGAQATDNFGVTVDRFGHHQAKVAEIFAKAAAAEKVLNALTPPSATLQSTTTQFQATPQGTQVMGQAPVGPAAQASRQAFLQHRAQSCAACHGGANAKGGFVVDSYDQMSVEQKANVWSRLVTNDPMKRMPRNQDGTPGAITAEQLQLWLSN